MNKNYRVTEGFIKTGWIGHPRTRKGDVTHEKDIRVKYGKLAIKLLVCKNKTAMRRAVKGMFGWSVRHSTAGICQGLGFQKGPYWMVDRKYVAVILLAKGEIIPSHVAHECTHAAMRYSERTGYLDPRYGKQKRTDEEKTCFACGWIFQRVNEFLTLHNLYDQ